MHTSATESILQWPHFNMFPVLRQMHVSIFHLEQSREPVEMRISTVYPYISCVDIARIINSFESGVNFWYPTMSITKLKAAQSLISERESDDSTASCLAYLVMALGCANLAVPGPVSVTEFSDSANEFQVAQQALGDIYMDMVPKKIIFGAYRSKYKRSAVFIPDRVSGTSCMFELCLLKIQLSLYYAFVRRPLQAWQYINMAATKCRVLLSYSPVDENSKDQECLRRIFWSCYILER